MTPLRANIEWMDDQRFELLADLGAMIAGEVELDDLLATFADRVARALGADRATLWLIDGATGEIRSRVVTVPPRSSKSTGKNGALNSDRIAASWLITPLGPLAISTR